MRGKPTRKVGSSRWQQPASAPKVAEDDVSNLNSEDGPVVGINMLFDLLYSLTNVLRTLLPVMDGILPGMQHALTQNSEVMHTILSFRSHSSSHEAAPLRQPL